MSNEKPVISESLIGIAETLIVGGIVFSNVDDAPAEQRTKTEYPYTVEELGVGSVELRRLATAWVTSAVAVNWEAWGADNRTPDELWGRLMYTLNNGCIAIGRKLRHNMTVDEIIAEFRGVQCLASPKSTASAPPPAGRARSHAGRARAASQPCRCACSKQTPTG